MKNIINKVLILIMSISALLYLINNIYEKNSQGAVLCIITFVMLLIPKIVKNNKINWHENTKLIYYIFLFVILLFIIL